MEKASKKKAIITFNRLEYIGIIILIFLAGFGPILLSRQAVFDISFLETGQIGDTIGGISAPFINLIAAFLVYKSFVAQIEANHNQRTDYKNQIKLIRQEQTLNTIIHLIERIETDVMAKENTVDGGFVNMLRAILNKFYQDREFPYSGVENKDTINLNSSFQHILSLIEINLGNLQRMFNVIDHYFSEYHTEKNVYDLYNTPQI